LAQDIYPAAVFGQQRVVYTRVFIKPEDSDKLKVIGPVIIITGLRTAKYSLRIATLKSRQRVCGCLSLCVYLLRVCLSFVAISTIPTHFFVTRSVCLSFTFVHPV